MNYQTENFPLKSNIYRWVKKFEAYGTVRNLNSKTNIRPTHSGRPTIRNEALVRSVESSVEQSPKRSLRKRSQLLEVSVTTYWRVMLKKDLNMFPYRIQVTQMLSENDKMRRKCMCEVLLRTIETNQSFLEN